MLLTDLHMPAAGNGITAVSAMSHSNPLAVTLVFSGYPEMQAALSAILLQAHEVLVPLDIPMSIFDQTPQILDGKVLCDDHAL